MTPQELRTRIRYDAHCERFTTELRHQDQILPVYIIAYDEGNLTAIVEYACTFWRTRRSWFKMFRDFVSESLLEQINACIVAQGHDEQTFSRTSLRRLLSIPSELGFDDGGYDGELRFEMSAFHERFYEHSVTIYGTMDSGVIDYDVAALF